MANVETAVNTQEAPVSGFLTKEELKSNFAATFGVSKKLANQMIDFVQGNIEYAVVIEGKAYRFPGLGTLKVKVLPAGTARNPQDNSEVEVPERLKVLLRNKPFILADVDDDADAEDAE